MSMSRYLRSATSGSGSAGLPDRFAMTPMMNGSWIFFSAPYSSTSYSIWTRGARLRAMNFWLLAFAMSLLLGSQAPDARAAVRIAVRALALFQVAGQPLEIREAIGQEILDDLHEILLHQPLPAPDEQRRRVARLVTFQVVADEIQQPNCLGTRADLTSHYPRLVRRLRRPVVGSFRRPPERRVAGFEQALQRMHQRLHVETALGSDALR